MAEMTSYRFCEISANDTWLLRAGVLWPEKEPGPSCHLPSDSRHDTFHYGVLSAEEVVSIGSFVREDHPELPTLKHYRLRAMATHKNHRQQGAGRMLLEGAIKALSDQGCTLVWADARHVALGFYARLNWDVVGPTYQVPLRGPHRLVWRRI